MLSACALPPQLLNSMRASRSQTVGLRRRRFQYARVLDELLGEDTVIASPTVCEEGWFADGVTPRIGRISASDGFNVAVHNMTGVPAISLPAGLSPNGIPFGLQFTGPRFRDDLLLATAEAWQSANPWPHTAPAMTRFSHRPMASSYHVWVPPTAYRRTFARR